MLIKALPLYIVGNYKLHLICIQFFVPYTPCKQHTNFTGYHGVVFYWLPPKFLQVATFATHVAGNLLCRKLFVSAPTSSTGQTLIEGQLPKLKANQVGAALGVAAARAT